MTTAQTFKSVIKIEGALGPSVSAAFGGLKGKLNGVQSELSGLRNKQKALLAEIKQTRAAGGSVAALERRYESLGAEITRVTAKQKKLQAAAARRQSFADGASAAKGQLFDAALRAATLAVPITAAVKFESALADLNKVAELSPAALKATGKEILNLSTKMPMSAGEIADIYTAAAQSGVPKAELKSFAENAIKMGVAFDISAKQAGETLANWRAGMKLTQPQVIELADTVNYLSNTSNATAPRITEVVTRMGAVAKTAGLASGEIAALASGLLQSGAAPEIAGTALKNLTNSLTKGEAATKAQSRAFEALGLDATAVAKSMQTDARGTLETVLHTLSKVEKDRQSALISQLFGEEAKGAIAPFLTNLDLLGSLLDKAADKTAVAGAMNKEYQAISATTANKLQLFTNNLNKLSVTIGNILIPPLNKAVTFMGGMADYVSGLAEKYPKLTQTVVLGGAAFLGLGVGIVAAKLAFFTLAPVVTFAAGALTKLVPLIVFAGGVFAKLASFIMFTGGAFIKLAAVIGSGVMSALATGITLIGGAFSAAASAIGISSLALGGIVVAIGAVIAAGVYLYQNWDTVKEKAAAVWNAVTAAVSSAVKTMGGWLDKLIGWTKPVIGAFKSVLSLFGQSETAANSNIPGTGGAIKQRAAAAAKQAREQIVHKNTAVNDKSKTTVHMTVNAAPGQSESGVADHVAGRIARRKRSKPLYDAVK